MAPPLEFLSRVGSGGGSHLARKRAWHQTDWALRTVRAPLQSRRFREQGMLLELGSPGFQPGSATPWFTDPEQATYPLVFTVTWDHHTHLNGCWHFG